MFLIQKQESSENERDTLWETSFCMHREQIQEAWGQSVFKKNQESGWVS